MKKICLILLIIAGFTSAGLLHAASLNDTQFDQYVQLTKNSKANPPGMTLVADKTYRVMYITMPIAIPYSSVTPEVIAKMKDAMLSSLKKSAADCKVIKDLKITVVYNFMTTDKYLFTIPFSYQEF